MTNTRNTSRILHNPSRSVKDLGLLCLLSYQNGPNASQSFTSFGEGFGKDLEGLKPHKNREKLSLYLNTSRVHAYPRAMRAHAYEGGVKDLFAGIGTSGQELFPDARGNSRAIEHSLFCLSEFQGGNYEGHIATDCGNQTLRTQPAN